VLQARLGARTSCGGHISCFLVFVMLSLGCSRSSEESQRIVDLQRTPPSPEQARSALIDLLSGDISTFERGGDWPAIQRTLQSETRMQWLRDEKITLDEGRAFIGGWTCDLLELTCFTVIQARVGSEYQVNARFEGKMNSTWKAVLTGVVHANLGPKSHKK
jgi:hypothetical protein